MLAAASVGVSGYYEVKWVVIRHGGPTVVGTPGWRGSASGLINARQNQRTLEGRRGQLLAYYDTPGDGRFFAGNLKMRTALDPATLQQS